MFWQTVTTAVLALACCAPAVADESAGAGADASPVVAQGSDAEAAPAEAKSAEKGRQPQRLAVQSGALVKEIQEALAKLGYDPGPADGIMGARTQRAIRAYEESKGLAGQGVSLQLLVMLVQDVERRGTASRAMAERDEEVMAEAPAAEPSPEAAEVDIGTAQAQEPAPEITVVQVADVQPESPPAPQAVVAEPVAAAVAAVAAAPPVEGDVVRLALVFGNSNYADSPLINPANDARLISQQLQKANFDVMVELNADSDTMKRRILEFGDRLAAAGKDGVGLFFYAGHGLQVDGENYLVPVNASIRREKDVVVEAVSANWVLSQMEYARNRLNLVVLDACRNNPYTRSFRSGTQGLARMDAPRGTLIAYSTAPGGVASDGEGENSPYTLALAKEMENSGLPIEQVFKRVRRSVLDVTGGQQTPWESSSLTGDFYFRRDALISASLDSGPVAAVSAPVAVAKPLAGQKLAGKPTIVKDCAVCPELVVVAAGSAVLGSPPDEPGRSAIEGPAVTIEVPRPFAIGRYEVTFDEWDACVADGACSPIEDDKGWGRAKRPVMSVSWGEAQRYVDWLSGKTGWRYRLPSEAEWEYAARAGGYRTRPWGDDIAWGKANCMGCGSKWDNWRTAPVGSFEPNANGMYDVLGNVSEWTADCYNPSHEDAPRDGSVRVTGSCFQKVVKGGSWADEAKALRFAARSPAHQSYHSPGTGLRVLREIGD